MKRHHRGLADPEDEEPEQHRHEPRGHVPAQNAARLEVDRARDRVHPDDAQELEDDRGREEDAQIHAPGALGLFRARVGDQREGGEREDLVEGEEGEQVAGEGHAHHGRDREGEEDVEAGLVLLVVSPHVADGVHGRDDPEEGRDQREEDAQRLGLQGDPDPGEGLGQYQLGARAAAYGAMNLQHDCEEGPGSDQARSLARVGVPSQQRDEPGAGDRHRHGKQQLRRHDPIPAISVSAACRATSAARAASMPKYRLRAASAQVGPRSVQGASPVSSSPGNSRK